MAGRPAATYRSAGTAHRSTSAASGGTGCADRGTSAAHQRTRTGTADPEPRPAAPCLPTAGQSHRAARLERPDHPAPAHPARSAAATGAPGSAAAGVDPHSGSTAASLDQCAAGSRGALRTARARWPAAVAGRTAARAGDDRTGRAAAPATAAGSPAFARSPTGARWLIDGSVRRADTAGTTGRTCTRTRAACREPDTAGTGRQRRRTTGHANTFGATHPTRAAGSRPRARRQRRSPGGARNRAAGTRTAGAGP